MYRYFLIALLCGAALANDEGRIVGGTAVNIVDFPYQVSIFYNGRHHCGGAILNSNFVITAGHCVDGLNRNSLEVYAGLNNTNDAHIIYSPTVTYTNVVKIIKHPGYVMTPIGTVRNDIAVLKVYPPLRLNRYARPIPVTYQEPQPGDYLTVTGYGSLSEGGRLSNQLMGVMVPAVSKFYCRQVYARLGINHINEEVFCAGYPQGRKDACQGDSGGPVMSRGQLVGVVSFGLGCARPGIPGVYTNIAHYYSWIFDSFAQ